MAEDVAQPWLALHCQTLMGATHGLVILGEPGRGAPCPIAQWPKTELETPDLLGVAREALVGECEVVRGGEPEAGSKRCWTVVALPFGVNSIASSVSLHLTQNIATQLQFSQIFGDFSASKMLVASIQHSPFPHWRVSPYVQLGTGILRTDSFSTIVQSEDSTNQTVDVGVGANIYLSRRFITYIDYRYHTVLTSSDKNEEIHEWKVGISIFF